MNDMSVEEQQLLPQKRKQKEERVKLGISNDEAYPESQSSPPITHNKEKKKQRKKHKPHGERSRETENILEGTWSSLTYGCNWNPSSVCVGGGVGGGIGGGVGVGGGVEGGIGVGVGGGEEKHEKHEIIGYASNSYVHIYNPEKNEHLGLLCSQKYGMKYRINCVCILPSVNILLFVLHTNILCLTQYDGYEHNRAPGTPKSPRTEKYLEMEGAVNVMCRVGERGVLLGCNEGIIYHYRVIGDNTYTDADTYTDTDTYTLQVLSVYKVEKESRIQHISLRSDLLMAGSVCGDIYLLHMEGGALLYKHSLGGAHNQGNQGNQGSEGNEDSTLGAIDIWGTSSPYIYMLAITKTGVLTIWVYEHQHQEHHEHHEQPVTPPHIIYNQLLPQIMRKRERQRGRYPLTYSAIFNNLSSPISITCTSPMGHIFKLTFMMPTPHSHPPTHSHPPPTLEITNTSEIIDDYHECSIFKLCRLSEDKLLMSSYDGKLSLWDIEIEMLLSKSHMLQSTIHSFNSSISNNILYIGLNSSIKIWHLSQEDKFSSLEVRRGIKGKVTEIAESSCMEGIIGCVVRTSIPKSTRESEIVLMYDTRQERVIQKLYFKERILGVEWGFAQSRKREGNMGKGKDRVEYTETECLCVLRGDLVVEVYPFNTHTRILEVNIGESPHLLNYPTDRGGVSTISTISTPTKCSRRMCVGMVSNIAFREHNNGVDRESKYSVLLVSICSGDSLLLAFIGREGVVWNVEKCLGVEGEAHAIATNIHNGYICMGDKSTMEYIGVGVGKSLILLPLHPQIGEVKSLLDGGRRHTPPLPLHSMPPRTLPPLLPLLLPHLHQKEITAIAFYKDRYLITGSQDKRMALWGVREGTLLRVFRGHFGYIRGFGVNYAYQLLLSYSDDLTLKAWKLPQLLEGNNTNTNAEEDEAPITINTPEYMNSNNQIEESESLLSPLIPTPQNSNSKLFPAKKSMFSDICNKWACNQSKQNTMTISRRLFLNIQGNHPEEGENLIGDSEYLLFNIMRESSPHAIVTEIITKELKEITYFVKYIFLEKYIFLQLLLLYPQRMDTNSTFSTKIREMIRIIDENHKNIESKPEMIINFLYLQNTLQQILIRYTILPPAPPPSNSLLLHSGVNIVSRQLLFIIRCYLEVDVDIFEEITDLPLQSGILGFDGLLCSGLLLHGEGLKEGFQSLFLHLAHYFTQLNKREVAAKCYLALGNVDPYLQLLSKT